MDDARKKAGNRRLFCHCEEGVARRGNPFP